MESISNVFQEIKGKYHSRFYFWQKLKFRNFISSYMKCRGYSIKEDKHTLAHNLCTNNLDKDFDYILMAHYDTACDNFLLLFSFFISAFSLLLYAKFKSVIFAFLIITFLPLLFISIFIPNRNNSDDNTSGILTLLSIADKLKDNKYRDNVLFLFLDNEEFGDIGSSMFYKKYKTLLKDKRVINFDCVGNGKSLWLYSLDNKYSHSNFANSLYISLQHSFSKALYPNFNIILCDDKKDSTDYLCFKDCFSYSLSTLKRFKYFNTFFRTFTHVHKFYDKKINLDYINNISKAISDIIRNGIL